MQCNACQTAAESKTTYSGAGSTSVSTGGHDTYNLNQSYCTACGHIYYGQHICPYNSWSGYLICAGNTHVWACDHADVCGCGKATRQKPACPHCGKDA
jgi:hypothetical protein